MFLDDRPDRRSEPQVEWPHDRFADRGVAVAFSLLRGCGGILSLADLPQLGRTGSSKICTGLHEDGRNDVVPAANIFDEV